MRLCGALFLLALGLHLLGSWSLPLLDRDEPSFAEASREMVQRGDFVVPHFNGHFRLDKPPLTYWMQAASYRAFGTNRFAARFPAALCAALATLVVLWFGRRLFGPAVGLYSALLFTLSVQVLIHGMAAVADMPMVLFFALALAAGWEVHAGRRKTGWIVLVLAMALGFLAKGPVVWLAVLPLAAISWPTPRRTRVLAGIGGTLVCSLLLVAAWGVPALLETRGAFLDVGLRVHVLDRSVRAFDGHGGSGVLGYLATLPFYAVTVFYTFFPGSVLLPWLVVRLYRKRRRLDEKSRYLFVAVAAVFGVFTLVATKLPHYVLPAFPALAILLVATWFGEGRPARRLVRLCAVGTVLWLGLSLVAFPLLKPDFPSPRLAAAAAPLLDRHMEFAAIGYTEPSLVWSFRKHVDGLCRFPRPQNAMEYLDRPGPRFLILPTSMRKRLHLGPWAVWRTVRVKGFNFVRFHEVDLTVVVKTGAPSVD